VAWDPAPGPPQTVSQGSQVDVLNVPVELRCPGPVAATFTAELSGVPSTVAFVTLAAQCLQPMVSAPDATAPCTPDETVTLAPAAYRIPLALGAGPEARTVGAAALLPPGQYFVSVLVGAEGGDVVVEKATLVVVAGGRADGAARGGGAPVPGPGPGGVSP
jgi:hypothetical protein